MPDVRIAGVGMTPFGKHPSLSVEHIGLHAAHAALKDSGFDRRQIDEVFCGSAHGGPMVGQRVIRDLGISGIPVTNSENACSSSSTALREAVTAIKAGRCETALVIGVDKLSALGGGTIPLEQTDPEVAAGMVMPALYAMRAQRYMHDFGVQPRDLALVSVKARLNAAGNEYAQMRSSVSVEDVLQSRMVADPLTLYMCCPTGDGAAAAVVSTRTKSRRAPTIAASILQSGRYKTGFRDMAASELTKRTAELAYDAAAIAPDDVDLAEVHDAFAIAELIYYEALGFCNEGEGAAILARGETGLGGRIPVNPSGGLLARGHPVGATGLAQVCECVWQLRGDAGARQVQGAKVALTQCTGGGIAGFDHGACTIHVLTI